MRVEHLFLYVSKEKTAVEKYSRLSMPKIIQMLRISCPTLNSSGGSAAQKV